MDRYLTRTIGLPIATDTGYKIGRVYDVIINVETGKVAGFITSPDYRRVLTPIDVLTWNHVLIVHDDEAITETEEIHSVSSALKNGIKIFRNRVVTKSGLYLGKVVDYAINDKMFVLTKIVVAKTFLGLVNYSHRIIAHKDILEIKKDGIIVKDPIRTVPIKTTGKLRVDSVAS